MNNNLEFTRQELTYILELTDDKILQCKEMINICGDKYLLEYWKEELKQAGELYRKVNNYLEEV